MHASGYKLSYGPPCVVPSKLPAWTMTFFSVVAPVLAILATPSVERLFRRNYPTTTDYYSLGIFYSGWMLALAFGILGRSLAMRSKAPLARWICVGTYTAAATMLLALVALYLITLGMGVAEPLSWSWYLIRHGRIL